MATINLNNISDVLPQEERQELYDFIRNHLDVVNETPFVEALMLHLEDLVCIDA